MIKRYRPGRDGQHGQKAEKKLSKRLDARLTKGSGASHRTDKADMVRGEFRIESKATEKDTYRVGYETLCKVAQEAAEQGEVPALAIQFVRADGALRATGGWVCIPEYVFKELTE